MAITAQEIITRLHVASQADSAINDDIEMEVEQRVETKFTAFLFANRNGDFRAAAFLFPPIGQAGEQTGFFVGRNTL